MDDVHELRAAVELVGLGRYRSDPLTQVIEWDARLKAMWDLAPDAPVDLAVFLSGIHPDDRNRVAAALGQSVDPAGDGVCDIEYRVVGVNGAFERWVVTRGKTDPVVAAAIVPRAQVETEEELAATAEAAAAAAAAPEGEAKAADDKGGDKGGDKKDDKKDAKKDDKKK